MVMISYRCSRRSSTVTITSQITSHLVRLSAFDSFFPSLIILILLLLLFLLPLLLFPLFLSDCRSLIQRMLVVNPDFRATLDDVKNSRWLASEQATMAISTTDLRPALDLNPDQLDETILKHMELFGYSREAVASSIKANQCNAAAATYILLLEKMTKMMSPPPSGQLAG